MARRGFAGTVVKFVGIAIAIVVIWVVVRSLVPDFKTKLVDAVNDLRKEGVAGGLAGGDAPEGNGPALPTTGTVTDVIGPYVLRLASGEQVSLIGPTVIGNVPAQRLEEAVEFLRSHLAGESIRLEYDNENVPREHRDAQRNLLVYVVRARDGFDVNADLIRQGHAHVDSYTAYGRMQEYSTYAEEARQAQRGVWQATEAGPHSDPPKVAEVSRNPTFFLIRDDPHFHALGCRYMDDRRVNATSKNSIKEADAQAQGMRICVVCGIDPTKIVYIDGRTFHRRDCPRLSDDCVAALRPTAREGRKTPCNYCNP